nr:hypothetical protein [Bacillota bacterium]
MPDTSTKLGLSLPLGNEAVTRLAYRQNLEQIDQKAAAQDQADEPFFLKSAIYNSGLNRIDCTFGKGRAAFLGTLVVKSEDSTTQIPNPIPSTSYYLYIKNDGTYAFNTTGVQIAGGVQIWKVTTGTTVDQITKEDRRGQLPGAAAKIVQDNLDSHNAAGDPHPQYALDSEKGAAGGIATLDAGGTIPDGQIPAAIARDSELAAHLANTTTMHGATSAATANKLIIRDTSGRAKVAAPSASDDIARKDTVDAVQTNLNTHTSDTTTAHGATSANTPNKLIIRDANGRAKVATPSASDDIARKAEVDAKFSWKIFISGTYDFNNRGSGSFIEEIKNNTSITLLNAPSNFGAGCLIQTEGSHSKWLQQLLLDQTDKIWFRTGYDNNGTLAWRSWQQVNGSLIGASGSLCDTTTSIPAGGTHTKRITLNGAFNKVI